MNNLSQECIEQIIANADKIYHPLSRYKEDYMNGAESALTNPTIYQSAGLMTVEEALRFAEWVANESGNSMVLATELLTIFRNQNKEK